MLTFHTSLQGIFNSILGWTNSATYVSVISYNLYWLGVMIAFGSLGYYEKVGHFPLLKARSRSNEDDAVESDQTSQEMVEGDKGVHVTSSPRENSV